MTEIAISLERGPDNQPAGRLTTGSGQILCFTGWLSLIRILEDQLLQSPQQPVAGGAVPGAPGHPAPGT
jgi:hypothetical protein